MSEQWRQAFERLRTQMDAEALSTPALRVVMAQTIPGGNSPVDLIRRAAEAIGANPMLSIYPPTQWRVTFDDGEGGDLFRPPRRRRAQMWSRWTIMRRGEEFEDPIGADPGELLTWTIAFCVDGDNGADPTAFWGLAAAAGHLLRNSPGQVFLGLRGPSETHLETDVYRFLGQRTEKGGWAAFWATYMFNLAHADTGGEVPLSDVFSRREGMPFEYCAAIDMHPARASSIAIRALSYFEKLGAKVLGQAGPGTGGMRIDFYCPSGPARMMIARESGANDASRRAESKGNGQVDGVSPPKGDAPEPPLAEEGKHLQWVDAADGYVTASHAITTTKGCDLSLSALSKTCRPDGPVRYMRRGQRLKVQINDFNRYVDTLNSNPDDLLEQFEQAKADIRNRGK